ncbi:MAG: ATP-binding protein [Pseudomonadota bacterium]
MNLLINQDYGDHSRKAVIKFFRGGIQFWNPGDVFGDDSRLFEPGEKEVRNPAIAMAMRRIAMCEQAGTGMRMMREEWQKLGHPEPTYKNDRSWKAFEFFIPELDKEVDMASDLMKAMFGKMQPESGIESGIESEVDYRILSILKTAVLSRSEIAKKLGHKSVSGAVNRAITRLLEHDLIEYTIPENPQSRLQKYLLTEKGRRLQAEKKGSL